MSIDSRRRSSRGFNDPVLTSALNELPRRVSAKYAIQVFQEGMLVHADGFPLGVPACSLRRLYDRLPCRDVRLGARVARLHFAGDRVSAVELHDGQMLSADVVVLAVGRQTARAWIGERDARLAMADRLEDVPILGVHLWFDRPVMRDAHVALLTGPLHWLFRKDAEGRVLHGVISAAREWVGAA